MGIVMIGFASPLDDAHDGEFNSWYENKHIPQVRAAVPGVRSVRRYRAADFQAAPEAAPHRYAAVYEIEGARPEEVLGALGAATASGALEPGSAMDTTRTPPFLAFYEPL
ncbi:DUF4286 family protein [Phytohabitans sp. ZYX-F-186]|uniref:DUF4286 family protein n=1 Tax=Phytohabitans maris TaxID=3071409 RepID=A0ABU0ZQQ2_9ACTN|nr:DUF4286 family protein [Phytohabitans sp. ZYX-F-186]MDQ7908555.1 DUF4286 family protein [Phytohabitans sp. ZYX-F-186]